jgi:uncharacterized protein YjbI with pentapeptide repeats
MSLKTPFLTQKHLTVQSAFIDLYCKQKSAMELIEITNTEKQLKVYQAMVNNASIEMACINGLSMKDVTATNVKIFDANLSDLEINGAQMGGAYIHSIGMPPKGHPHYDETAIQRPLKFEDCFLEGSTITNCDLKNVSISDCELAGMTINGILVEDLLKVYNKQD